MKGLYPDNPTIWQTGRPTIQSQPDAPSKGTWIIHSECFPVYREVGESGGRKMTVHLSRLYKAAEWSQQQRDTRSRAAELKYTALVMSYLNSEFILRGITQKHRGSGQHWRSVKKGPFHGSFCSTGRRFSLSRRHRRSCSGKRVLGLGKRRREQ